MTSVVAVRELYEAARFSLAVHLSAGVSDAGKHLAAERLTRALVAVNHSGVLHSEQSKGESDGRVG